MTNNNQIIEEESTFVLNVQTEDIYLRKDVEKHIT